MTYTEARNKLKEAKEVAKIAAKARSAARQAVADTVLGKFDELVSAGKLKVSSNESYGKKYTNGYFNFVVSTWSGSVDVYDCRFTGWSWKDRQAFREKNPDVLIQGALRAMRSSCKKTGMRVGYDTLNEIYNYVYKN